jgi:hypothetical protein
VGGKHKHGCNREQAGSVFHEGISFFGNAAYIMRKNAPLVSIWGMNFRKRNKTMFNSAADDFARTTLAAVSGILAKLEYVAGLRQTNGEYFHWGMARSHGTSNANFAIAAAHTNLFLSILRTPVRDLWEEVRILADEESTDARIIVSRLQGNGELLIPSEMQGGVPLHFNSILVGLYFLAEQSAAQTGQGA